MRIGKLVKQFSSWSVYIVPMLGHKRDIYQLDTVRSSSSQECKQSSIKREKTEQKKNLVLDCNCDPLFQGSINPDTQTTLTWLAPRPRTTDMGAVAENANL